MSGTIKLNKLMERAYYLSDKEIKAAIEMALIESDDSELPSEKSYYLSTAIEFAMIGRMWKKGKKLCKKGIKANVAKSRFVRLLQIITKLKKHE